MSVTEFLKQSAVELQLGGRYSLANRRDPQGNRRQFACRTARLTPFRMLVSVPVLGAVGERVISHFGEFGQLDGWITEVAEGGFLMELALAKARREKFTSKLLWLDKQQKNPSVRDARNSERVVPVNPHSTLILADGSTLGCFVIDVSTTGVAVSADAQPEIGMPLAVGRTVGRVVRHFAEGFAVQFSEKQHPGMLEHLIEPPSGKLSQRPLASNICFVD